MAPAICDRLVARGAPGETANRANPIITPRGKLNNFSSSTTTNGTSTTTARRARNSKAGFRHRNSIFSKERLIPRDSIREKIVTLTSRRKKGWFIGYLPMLVDNREG